MTADEREERCNCRPGGCDGCWWQTARDADDEPQVQRARYKLPTDLHKYRCFVPGGKPE